MIYSEVKNKFLNIVLDVSDPLGPDELLCKCSERGCDRDIVDIAGANYSGICRAHKGGMCRKTIQLDIEGHVKDAALA